MGFVKDVKLQMVRETAERCRGQANLVLVDYRGLTARQASDLRRALGADGIGVEVVKNSVARVALKEAGLGELGDGIEGMNALVTGEDPVLIAKKIHEFIDRNKVLEVRRGWIEGRLVSAGEIKGLSKLPSREELLGGLVGTIAAPLTQFVSTANEVLGAFVRTLAALEEKQREGSST